MAEKEQKALAERKAFPVPSIMDAEGVQEEMDGLQFNFTYVKIPAGGQLAFELPGEDDDEPDYLREIEGVIVYHHPVNVYWEQEYDGSNEPPDCMSNDGKVGIGVPGGYCKDCPMNQWGSGNIDSEGKTRGKACNNRRRVYLLREGEMFPMLFSLPPTSLQNFGNFVSRSVLQKGLRSYQTVAKAKLKKASSGSGIEYSQVLWLPAGRLDDESAEQMRYYSEEIKAIAHKLEFEDVEGSEGVTEQDEYVNVSDQDATTD